jgi:K+-sensing histidine kinase KdpD
VDEVVVGTLLVVAAVICGISILVPRSLRAAANAIVIVGIGAAAWSVDVSPVEVALSTVLLTLLAVTATMVEGQVAKTRAEQRRAQEAANRRTALLTTARDIADLDVEEAVAVALRALRQLGFNGAGIGIVRDEMVVPVRLDNLPATPGPVPVTEGVAGRAVRLRATQAVADYQQDPDRLPDRDAVGMMVATPIIVRDDVAGVLAGSAQLAAPPRESQREVIEVIAGHLGVAFDNRRRVENQRLLLERMDRLDAMRTAFVDQVSDELRDPLTVVRGAGHTLRSHGDILSSDARGRLIDRLCGQAEVLQRIVDVVLDFSRFQASHQLSERHWVGLHTVMAPFQDRIQHSAEGADEDVLVHVDAELLRYALALLLDETPAMLTLRVDACEAVLTLDDARAASRPLARSLVEQLVLESGASLQAVDPVTIRMPRFDVAQEVRL